MRHTITVADIPGDEEFPEPGPIGHIHIMESPGGGWWTAFRWNGSDWHEDSEGSCLPDVIALSLEVEL